jgi:peptidoglycan L-alanyl-D-glutamate endopeptidase CwlK
MTFALSQKSQTRLAGVHADLVKVVEKAITITEVDFVVLEGVRTLARQQELLRIGASQTLKSRHLGPVGHAVDLGALVNGKVEWHWPLYHQIANAMKLAAGEVGVPIEWGGDWKRFKDGPHFQLPWAEYP